MAGTNAQQQRLMRERARALATLALTRRADVSVANEMEDVGVDLMVRIHSQDKPGLRQFGVELRYTWTAVTAAQAKNTLTAVLLGHKQYAPFPFPVVLFYYTMENDEGWYTWVTEPSISRGGIASLPVR